MLILGDEEVQTVLKSLSPSNCQRLLNALSKSLVDFSSNHDRTERLVHQPMRQVFTTAPGHTSLFMPASNTATTGIKVVTLPGTGGAPRGSINIYAPEGDLVGLLNAEEVTAFRTALTSMIAFLKCPFPKTRVVVFGAGKQAEWHVRLSLLLAGDAIKSITVVNRSSNRLDELAKRLVTVKTQYPEVDFRWIAKDDGESDYETKLQTALQESDAIMCCTPSTEPLFPSRYLTSARDNRLRQRFISLIGSYTPTMQEVDSGTLQSGRYIYVDSKEACLKEAGELIKANVKESRLVELGHMLSQPSTGRIDGNMVFKCVGMGIMDVVVGSEILNIAKEMDIGRIVNNF